MSHAVSDVISQLTDLPPFPQVTTKLLRLLDDSTVSVEELAQVISSDPSLVLRVIQVANSPFYMLSRPVESVKEAVFVLGITTIKSITTAISIQKGLQSFAPRKDVFDQSQFWKHSYATAIAARWLATRDQLPEVDRFYLGGLIHDVGKLVQARFWPDSWKHVLQYMRLNNVRYEEAEIVCFSTGHQKLVMELCRNWQFPDAIIEMLSCDTDSPPSSGVRCQSVVAKANCLAEYGGYKFPVEDCAACMSDLSEKDLEYVSLMLPREMDYQLRLLEH